MKKSNSNRRTIVPIRHDAKGKNKRKPKEPILFFMEKGMSKFHN